MMRKSSFRLSGLAVVAAVVAVGALASDRVLGQDLDPQYRGTQAQQEACQPDVFRLCQAEIPDVPRIVACLQRERRQLSVACRTALEEGAPQTRAAAASTGKARRHSPSDKPLRITP